MMAGAFEGGQGDFVTLFEPTCSSFCNKGKGYRVISVGKESGEVPYTCYVARKDYIEENSEVVKGFLKAISRGKKYMETHTVEEVAKVLKPQFDGTSEKDIANAVRSYLEIDVWMTNMSMTEDSFERLQDVMVNAKVLENKAKYEKLVDNSYADEAYKEVFKK